MSPEEARLKSGLLTVKEVAVELRVSRMTAYRLIKSGKLGAIQPGRAFRVPEAELAAFKKRNTLPSLYDDEKY